MADYFAHWFSIGAKADRSKLPKLFWVNWFRKDEDGSFLWPGYGDNSRVLEWVLERCGGEGEATDTPIGLVPTIDAIDRAGLDVDDETMAKLLAVDHAAWRHEVTLIEAHFAGIGERLPAEMSVQLDELQRRLGS
jgi:phosphoenolpyruvate carboxykinase (GTP)